MRESAKPGAAVSAGGLRARARRELTRAIVDAAEQQLVTHGAAALSLRAIARDLGMASSAIYRYFASRDDLLTVLVIDAYNDLGAAVEEAVSAASRSGAEPASRWMVACRAVRGWAMASPHRYALIYGSPVPGYRAPAETIAPASRVGLVLANIVADAARVGGVSEPHSAAEESLADELGSDAARLAAMLELELPPRVVIALIAAWSQVFGMVSFELNGQFENMISARAEFFDKAITGLARSVGLAT